MNFHLKFKKTSAPAARNPEYNNMYNRYYCARSYGYTTKTAKRATGARPSRDSLKCNCGFYINAAHPMLEDRSGRDLNTLVITGLSLDHTNGCLGNDPEMNHAIKKRSGRCYPDAALTHLRKEVVAGRYETKDVHDWLVDYGYRDATLNEATNLRYRLLKKLPIKGWDKAAMDDKRMIGEMRDYLFCTDLAQEVTAGGQESITNLRILHDGLSKQIDGYDFRMSTDSENRFAGTAWQTGRMRARLRIHGVLIFIDDSRSGINTSGFSFWNVMTVNEDKKSGTAMGAMTMDASDAAVYWVLRQLVEMAPFAADVIKQMLSDLGECFYLWSYQPLLLCLTNKMLCFCCYVYLSQAFPSTASTVPSQMYCSRVPARGT